MFNLNAFIYDDFVCILTLNYQEMPYQHIIQNIILDIEADQEESEQPLEQYKQSIEQFYESFNQLNIQFHRSKQQELKKQQRIALLGVGQCFGINEVAENIQKRQVTAVCISTNSEVYLLDKQVYLHSAKELKIYKDFNHQNNLIQTWRNKQIQSSKNLFQKFEYRKYNIQTNKSVKQIKGLCEIPIETSQSVITPKQNNFMQNGKQNTQDIKLQQKTKNFNFNFKIKQFSLHTSESTSRNNIMNNQTATTRNYTNNNENLQEKRSLSPRLEQQYTEEKQYNIYNKRTSIKTNTNFLNNKLEIKEQTIHQTSQILIQKSDSDRDINQISLIIPMNSGNSSKFQTQRNILSSIIKGGIIENKKNEQDQDCFYSAQQIKDQNKSENLRSRRQSKVNISPKKFCEEDVYNKFFIFTSEKESKKKNKQAQKYNAIVSNTTTQPTYENTKKMITNEQSIDKKQSSTPKGEPTPKTSMSPKPTSSPKVEGVLQRSEINSQQANIKRRYSRFRRKKSLEAIRSEKLDSSFDIKQILGTQELTNRFQEMVEMEDKLQQQLGRLQPTIQTENFQNQSRRDSNSSVQSLKCFEKIFQDSQETINKKFFLDPKQSKNLNEVRQSFSINREQEILDQIVRRNSINLAPIIQVNQTSEGTEGNGQTPRNNNMSNKLSTFFSASRDSISPQSKSRVGTQIYNEKQQTSNCQNNDSERNKLNSNRSEEVFSQQINKNSQYFLSPKNSQKNISLRRFTQFNEQISINQIENNPSSLNEEKLNQQDVPLIPLNKISQRNLMNNICSPNNNRSRISSMCSFKNEDIKQQEKSQKLEQIKERPINKPTIIDYNFVDSSRISKYQKIKNPNINQNETQSPQQQSFTTQNLENQEKQQHKSPLKYKRTTVQVECDDFTTSKSSFSQFTSRISPSKLLQTNQTSLNNLQSQNKSRSSMNQIEASVIQTPEKGSSQPIIGISNKPQTQVHTQTDRPNYFKKETINQEIQQNKPKSSSNQRQFLFELLNKNTSISQHQNSNISNTIAIQPFSKDLYKLSQSYYKKPINQSVITAYSSPRKIVFQFQKKTSNSQNNNSSGSKNINIMRKTLNHINQIN